jgi:hypothetical protein
MADGVAYSNLDQPAPASRLIVSALLLDCT